LSFFGVYDGMARCNCCLCWLTLALLAGHAGSFSSVYLAEHLHRNLALALAGTLHAPPTTTAAAADSKAAPAVVKESEQSQQPALLRGSH
jgi:hypothetical protein